MSDRVPNRLKEILEARKKKYLYPCSYYGLAVESDTAANTVINLANGVYFPKLDTAYKIARALNLTVYDIWNEFEIKHLLNKLTNAQADALMRAMELMDEG